MNYQTIKEHMPPNHQSELEARGWTAESFLEYASFVGPHTRKFFESVLSSCGFVEQNYKACLGVKKLSHSYGKERMEAACKRALPGKHTYGVIRNILENNLDQQPDPFAKEGVSPIVHKNLRGKKYYC